MLAGHYFIIVGLTAYECNWEHFVLVFNFLYLFVYLQLMQFVENTIFQNSTLQRNFGKRLLKLCLHMI